MRPAPRPGPGARSDPKLAARSAPARCALLRVAPIRESFPSLRPLRGQGGPSSRPATAPAPAALAGAAARPSTIISLSRNHRRWAGDDGQMLASDSEQALRGAESRRAHRRDLDSPSRSVKDASPSNTVGRRSKLVGPRRRPAGATNRLRGLGGKVWGAEPGLGADPLARGLRPGRLVRSPGASAGGPAQMIGPR